MRSIPKREKEEFGKRLKSEIRGAGLTQRDFLDELKRRGEPISHRALTNYVSGHRRPADEWVEAAAEVFNVRVEWLRTGEEPRRRPRNRRGGLKFRIVPIEERASREDWVKVQDAGDALMTLVEANEDVPMHARFVFTLFLLDYFAEAEKVEKAEAERILRRYFAPLLAAGPKLTYPNAVALACSLAAAAYQATGARPDPFHE